MKKFNKATLFFALLSCFSFAGVDYDTLPTRDFFGENRKAPVDSYMLTLSYSPNFCEQQRQKHGRIPKNNQYQCDPNNHFKWVVHGLWPQNSYAQSVREQPRFCQGNLPLLPESELQPYLKYSPSKALLQSEWEKHGACAFRTARDYFNMEKVLYEQLVLPANKPNKRRLIEFLKKHNPQLRNVFIKVNHNEISICYDKKWKPIDCLRAKNTQDTLQ